MFRSKSYSGGYYFYIGKFATVQELGLSAVNNYKFSFKLKYALPAPIQVTITVRCNDQYTRRSVLIRGSDQFQYYESNEITVANSYDYVEFTMASDQVTFMNGITSYGVTPSNV